jgi:hypothetical protein
MSIKNEAVAVGRIWIDNDRRSYKEVGNRFRSGSTGYTLAEDVK